MRRGEIGRHAAGISPASGRASFQRPGLGAAAGLVQRRALAIQQRGPGDDQALEAERDQRVLGFALDLVVEDRRARAGAQRGDQAAVRRAGLARGAGDGHDGVEIGGAEGRARTGLRHRRAQRDEHAGGGGQGGEGPGLRVVHAGRLQACGGRQPARRPAQQGQHGLARQFGQQRAAHQAAGAGDPVQFSGVRHGRDCRGAVRPARRSGVDARQG